MKVKSVEKYKEQINKRLAKKVKGEGYNYYSTFRSMLAEEAGKTRFYTEVYPDQDMINENIAYTLLQKEYTAKMNEYKAS